MGFHSFLNAYTLLGDEEMRWNIEFGVFFILTALCLVFLTYVDFIVHGILYHYGLVFSYAWAIPYWVGFAAFNVTLAILVGVVYLMSRENTLRNVYTAWMLGLTMLWQYFSGNEDLLWFVIAKLHGWNWIGLEEHWTWSPYNMIFNTVWTTKDQIALTVIMNCVLVGLWVVWWACKHGKG
jgi:hypothetical protein